MRCQHRTNLRSLRGSGSRKHFFWFYCWFLAAGGYWLFSLLLELCPEIDIGGATGADGGSVPRDGAVEGGAGMVEAPEAEVLAASVVGHRAVGAQEEAGSEA